MKRILAIVFTMSLLLAGCSFRYSPPSSEEAKEFLYQNKESIKAIADYLINLEYESIIIDKDDGSAFYNYEYHDIANESIRSHLRNIWRAGCTRIEKDDVRENNTISLEIWYRTMGDADCGIACTINGQGKPNTEFQICCESIDQTWFYYYDNYEEYRQDPARHE